MSAPEYQDLLELVAQTGIWNGSATDPHQFVLSPFTYEISEGRLNTLNEFSRNLHACMHTVTRAVAIGENQSLGAGTVFGDFAKATKAGTPYNLPTLYPNRIPFLCKVDMVEDEDGSLRAVEIDATNPRSWGYSILGRQLAQAIKPEAKLLPGVVNLLTNFGPIKKLGAITFLYGHTQRFYLPEFLLFAKSMRQAGVDVKVACETEVTVCADGIYWRDGNKLPELLVDFPPMNRNAGLIAWLKQAYLDDRVRFVIPPSYFLASKATLTVLSAGQYDRNFEAVKHMVQPHHSPQRKICRYVADTAMVESGVWGNIESAGENSADWVLKRCVSSGAKGVWVGGEEGFEEALLDATESPGQFVLQKQIQTKTHTLSHFQAGELLESDGWRLRLTVYCSPRGVADIAITARQGKLVHGATDAILTGTVVVE